MSISTRQDPYRVNTAEQEYAYFKRFAWTRNQIQSRLLEANNRVLEYSNYPPEVQATVLFWRGVRDGCVRRLTEMKKSV